MRVSKDEANVPPRWWPHGSRWIAFATLLTMRMKGTL